MFQEAWLSRLCCQRISRDLSTFSPANVTDEKEQENSNYTHLSPTHRPRSQKRHFKEL